MEDVTSGKVRLDAIPVENLPEPVRTLSKPQQQALIDKTAQKRQQLKDEIAALGEERQRYIAKTVSEKKVEASLDGKIYETVRSQAASKGLRYGSRPSL